MEQALAVSDLAALNAKLDDLSAQVAFLAEQARDTARRQQERSELMHDLLPIANDAVGLVTEQLDEIQEYVDLSDLLRLLKRLLRNGRNLDQMLDQLESLMDLAQTVGPLSDSMFEKATDVLQAAEHRGYFALAGGAAHAVDKVATSVAPEDLDRFADNLVVVLGAFKELDLPTDTGFRSLLKQMRDPEVQRGLAAVLRAMRRDWGKYGQEPLTQSPPKGGDTHGYPDDRRQRSPGQRRGLHDRSERVEQGHRGGYRRRRGHPRADRRPLDGDRVVADRWLRTASPRRSARSRRAPA